MSDYIGKRFGEYMLLRLLGEGGFSKVYLGEHTRDKTLAAIKVLTTRLTDQQDLKGFIREARSFRLQHPHIVQLLDFDILDDGTPFLVMAYAPNGTLRTRYPKGTVLALETVISYLKPVAEALDYAHSHHLIHRDVKPENILLASQNEIWLSDFGIAVTAHNSISGILQNKAGTVLYMAPEQIQGKPQPASDQYALGITVYEWLSGTYPFNGGSTTEIALQHINMSRSSLAMQFPTVSPAVRQVIIKALAIEPQQRFGSVQEFSQALEGAYDPKKTINFAQIPTVYPPSQTPTIPAPPPLLGSHLPMYRIQDPIDLIQWSADGRYLALRRNNQIEIRDTTDIKTIFSYQGQRSILYPQDHITVSIPPPLKSIGIFKKRHLQPPSVKNIEIPVNSSFPSTIAWSPNAQIIAIGNSDGTVLLWDADLKNELLNINVKPKSKFGFLNGHVYQGARLVVAWSKDGKYLTSTFYYSDHYLSSRGEMLYDYHYPEGYSHNVNKSPRSRIDVWDVVKREWLFGKDFEKDNDIMKISPNGDQVALSLNKAIIQIWDIATSGMNFSFKQEGLFDLEWSQDGKHLISVTRDRVSIWDSVVGHQIGSFADNNIEDSVAWSPDESQIAFIRRESFDLDVAKQRPVSTVRPPQPPRELEIWNLATHKKLFSIPNASYKEIQWSSDMHNIFLFGEDRVEVWNNSNAKRPSHVYNFSILALSPNGTRLATANPDKTLQLWEVATRNHLFTYPGYAGKVRSIAWSPDGKRFAIVLDDSTIQILEAL